MPNGTPLDRWERDVDQVREHIAFVEESRALAGKCDDVLLARETGPRFWSRLAADIAALERVIERDCMYVDLLVEPAALEAEKRAKWEADRRARQS